MKLLVVRHGEAEPMVCDDASRSLTDRGKAQVSELWYQLHDKGVQVSRIVASPFLRTQQTAGLIVEHYAGLAIETSGVLLSEADPQAVLDWLQQQPQEDGLVLVSHMPLVGILVGLLTEGASARLPFVPGMVACLDIDVAAVNGGRLRWSISPETGVVK